MTFENVRRDGDDGDDESDTAPLSPKKTASMFLAEALVASALSLSMHRQLTSSPGRAVVVEVPSISYGEPMRTAFEALLSKAWILVVTEKKKKSWSDDDKGIIAQLAFGRSVVFITQDMSLVPPVVSAALDLTLVIKPPTAKQVRRVINLVTGGAARGLADADLAGWTFEQIVATIRPGSTARECVNRLKRARVALSVTATDATPDLRVLPLFGPARNWADESLRELERQRRGESASANIENVLLYGPPGTGKTLLARAFAKSANLPFVSTSMAAWFSTSDGHLDGVLKQAEAFFQALLDAAPCVGLMDEIEALPNRATMNPQYREWWSGLVTGILLLVTKVTDSGRGVILIGATNYRDQVDTALLRPGRLGRHVLVRPAETEEEVTSLLRYYVGTDLTAEEIAQAASAAGIPTAAEVEGWVKAARRSARDAERALVIDDLLRHMSPDDDRTQAELYECAVHEAGHAIAVLAMRFDLRSVSIIARGRSGGVTRWSTGALFHGVGHVEDRVVVTLAGRAADQVVGKGPDAGATADLEMATALLVATETAHGLRGTLLFRGDESRALELLSVDPALALRTEATLQRLMTRAVACAEFYREAIVAIASRLVERRMLSGVDVERIVTDLQEARHARPATGKIVFDDSDDTLDERSGCQPADLSEKKPETDVEQDRVMQPTDPSSPRE
jgi:cell division protease FtsH